MIEFDTVHLDNSDLLLVSDITIFNDRHHIFSLRDIIQDSNKGEGKVFVLDTQHKLFDPRSETGIEFTMVSMFLPHTFPPKGKTIVDMIKAHYFHTDAILNLKSKSQQIKGHIDVLLYPDNRTIEKRTQNFEALIHQVIQDMRKEE